MFIWFIILAILAVIAIAIGIFFARARKLEQVRIDAYNASKSDHRADKENDVPPGGLFVGVGVLFGIVAAVFLIFSTTFTVDTGSAKVLKDWTGIVAEDPIVTPGIHTKAPWQDAITWDIKNQDVTFTGDGKTSHNGQQVAGAELVFTDKDGVSGKLDIQVLFSIRPEETVTLTRGYSNQDDFEIKVVENDVKALPRDVISTYTTVQVFEERAGLRSDIEKLLEETWADKGVIVDNVNIHGIRYPKDVQQRFKDAQNAQTDKLKAETEAETAKTKADGEAQAEIARAQGEAEANRLLSESLTPQVLQQRWIDALSKSNTIIVPQDFTSLGNLTPQQ